MAKTELNEPKRSFKLEIISFILFMGVAAAMSVLKVENYISLSMVGVGLLALYLNDVNKAVDLILAILWSGLYAYFCYINGLASNGVLISLFYLVIKLHDIAFKVDTKELVKENNKLKGHEIFALLVVSVCLVVGSFFLSRLWINEKLAIFDALSAVLFCISLYLMMKRTTEYFIVRLIAMAGQSAIWVAVALLYGFGTGSLHITLMFVAYIVYDMFRLNKWSYNHTNIAVKEKSILDSEEYKQAQRKYDRAHKTGLPSKSVGVDKDSKRK